MIGEKFGRLTVIEQDPTSTIDGKRKWICVCDCGKRVSVIGTHLRNGNTTSCGCYKLDLLRERVTKCPNKNPHLYTAWRNMKQRCLNPHHPAFRYYGARGISVCKEWSDDYAAFQGWALNHGYLEGLTIDRINNDGNYEPSNCRWVTMSVQCNNKRNNKIKDNTGRKN